MARAADDVAHWEVGEACPDVLVVGARGSGQERDSAGNFTPNSSTLGLGPEVHNFAHWLTGILDDHGITVGAFANPYPAVQAGQYFDVDKGLFWSVDQGEQSTRIIAAVVADQCGPSTKIVLAGYSQGAWVAREGAAFVQAEVRDQIAAVVLIADPQFDPDGGGSQVGDPRRDKGGIAGRVPVADFLASRTVNVCRAGDLVCQSETPSDIAAYGLSGGAVIHTSGYKGFEMGFGAAVLAASRILGGSSDGGSGATVALIVDSSGSMITNDPGNRRNAAGRAFLNATTGSDAVGVVDFDEGATVLSEARNPVTERDELIAALDLIDSSGGTNLGAGLSAGCGVLERSTLEGPKAAIFLTDGDGSYSGQAQCYAEQGWPIFTFGLGAGVNQVLLEGISAQTEGTYTQLSDATDLVCEFQQIRAAIADEEHETCAPTGTIQQDQLLSFIRQIPALLRQITFAVTWPGSDVEMTLISPAGRRIGRDDSDFDVSIEVGAGFQTMTVANPEAGDWTVELLGLEVSPGGEPFTLSTVNLPGRNQEPVPGFSAVRTPGSTADWSFDASPSFDPDGALLGYLWSFGDGNSGEGPTPAHTFALPGRYDVSLTVVDEDGAMATMEREILVDSLGQPLVPSATGPPAPRAGDARVSGLAKAARVATVRGRKALLRLYCLGLGPCQGTASLTVAGKSGNSARRRLGSASFSIPQERSTVLRIPLSKAGRKMLKQAGDRGLRVKVVGSGMKGRRVKLMPALTPTKQAP